MKKTRCIIEKRKKSNIHAICERFIWAPDISSKHLDQPFELGNEGLSRETSTLVQLWHSRAIIQSQNF